MSPPTPAALSHRQAAFTLALLLGLQPVATDVYLPALPLLTRELGARMAHAQLTMAGSSFVYIDVLGLSPRAYGAAMAAGSLCYTGGTLLCRRWIHQHGMAGTVVRGGFFTQAGGALGAVLAPVAFGVGSWRGVALDHSGRPLMGGLAFWSAAICCVASTLVQKAGR